MYIISLTSLILFIYFYLILFSFLIYFILLFIKKNTFSNEPNGQIIHNKYIMVYVMFYHVNSINIPDWSSERHRWPSSRSLALYRTEWPEVTF